MDYIEELNNRLKGKNVTNFTYIHDYFQFQIENFGFNLYGPFIIKNNNDLICIDLKDKCYKLRSISDTNNELVIEFENNYKIIMDKGNEEFGGPEWYQINGPNNLIIVEQV